MSLFHSPHFPHISKPIFLIGAENDEEVGTDIDRLFVLANEPKQLWRPEGSNYVIVDELTEEYHRRVLEFLETTLRVR